MSDIKKYEPLWGTWDIDSLLGKGSFGEVYKIRREVFGRTHYSALKRIPIPHDEDEMRQMRSEMDEDTVGSFLQALLRDLTSEIDLMSELRGNSNIVSFEDYLVMKKPQELGWDILIRMELLESLSNRLAEAPLALPEILKMGMHMCRALELCAAKNIIHRDIKPDNIFISQYGEYKLGDFGLARQLERTVAGLSKKGTYTYMAPEVFRGEAYGSGVDIYSLGIVLYRLLNQNRAPFLPDFPQLILPDDRDKALQRRMQGERFPDLKGVGSELNALVLKACAYNREERFRSPTEMREALENMARSAGGVFVTTEVFHSSDTYILPHAIQKTRSGQNSDALPGQPECPAGDSQEDRKNPVPEGRKTKKTRFVAILFFCGVLAVGAIVFTSLWGGDFLGNSPNGNTENGAVVGDDELDGKEKEKLNELLYHAISIPKDFADMSDLSANEYMDFSWHTIYRDRSEFNFYEMLKNGKCSTQTIEMITSSAFGKPFTDHATTSHWGLQYKDGVYEFFGADGDAVPQSNIFDIQAKDNKFMVKFNIITGHNSEEFLGNASAVVIKSAKSIFGFNILSLQRDLPLPIFTAATASSTLAPQGTNNYIPSNVLNSDKNKAWVEGVDGNGVGEWIELSSDSLQNISGISLQNGYIKDNNLYKKNNRPKRIKIQFSDGTSFEKTLLDELEKQVITFDREIPTTFVRITILDVFKGTHYEDTCMSSIAVF